MQQYYFELPFANGGDKTTIPITVQSNGSISFPDGYSVVYQNDLQTDPSALAIDRRTFNELMFAITQNLQNYQNYGTPEFIDNSDNGGSAFAYDVGAIVRYSSSGTAPFKTYVSTVTNNTTTPGTAGSWFQLAAPVFNAISESANNTDVCVAQLAEFVMPFNGMISIEGLAGGDGAFQATGGITFTATNTTSIYGNSQTSGIVLSSGTISSERMIGQYLGLFKAVAGVTIQLTMQISFQSNVTECDCGFKIRIDPQ
jgi:hypothetical protein